MCKRYILIFIWRTTSKWDFKFIEKLTNNKEALEIVISKEWLEVMRPKMDFIFNKKVCYLVDFRNEIKSIRSKGFSN